MAGYRQSRPEKAKAAAAAVGVHLAIGLAFLTGLANDVAQRQSEALQTFDVTPPPPVIDVELDDSAPSGDPGEAGVKAEPTPVVAPEPEIAAPAAAGRGSAVAAAVAAGSGPRRGCCPGTGRGFPAGCSGSSASTEAMRVCC